MDAYKAVIAEDEPLLRAELRESLAKLWPELRVCAEVEDGVEALHAIEQHAPEILFLDIQMPGLSGLDVARAASNNCHVVFVTGYDQYAVAAFESGAIDYLMKPVSAARLATACQRVRERISNRPADLEVLVQRLQNAVANKGASLRWINAESNAKVQLVTVEEVCYFQADSKYTWMVTADREALIRIPLIKLLE